MGYMSRGNSRIDEGHISTLVCWLEQPTGSPAQITCGESRRTGDPRKGVKEGVWTSRLTNLNTEVSKRVSGLFRVMNQPVKPVPARSGPGSFVELAVLLDCQPET